MTPLIVIKIGGSPLQKDGLRKKLLKNLVKLSKKYHITVVHGGKAQIDKSLKKLHIKTKFINGHRYTDRKTLKAVRQALSYINRQIADELSLFGASPLGLSGLYGNLLTAARIKPLGYVGKIKHVNSSLIRFLLLNKNLPVIYPICKGTGTILNVNADVVASEIAIALKADKLIYISDVPGVIGKSGKVIRKINTAQINKLKSKKVITGGMIPKIDGCYKAIKKGVKEIYITDNVNLSQSTKFNLLPGTRISKSKE
jgi:acetylglutamate kinase